MAGHSIGHYPSYYPDEISIEAVDPATAARRLGEGTLHAYVGEAPLFEGDIPDHLAPVTSLGSFLVLTLDRAAASLASSEGRCAAARSILGALREADTAGFVFHPYPVTPYHADYLHHLDRVEEVRRSLDAGDGGVSASLKVHAEGPIAQAVARARWALGGEDAEVTLHEVPADRLIAEAGAPLNDGLGPPWEKEGWFQARRLLARPPADELRSETDEIDRTYARLMRGEVRDLAERADLERRLVAALTGDCERLVVGYSVKEEYTNRTFTEGVENVAYDSHSGLNSPVFLRTVKLKAYPWNGSLHLGLRARAQAAWNPVAGFSDAAGRLIWLAVSDPAMIPFPFNASWIPNRVHFEASVIRGQSGGLKVPADAILPRSGSRTLGPVGDWTFASAKVLYEVLASPFQDGTEMEMADLVYPFVFASRWAGEAGLGGKGGEPRLEAAWASLRDRLAGLRPLRVESTVNTIAPGFDIVQKTPVLEVYLRDAPGDDHQVSALAPPWSALPWHLLVLMEEAADRGLAAFSQEEAERRRISWLDLVRDPPLHASLLDLIAAFERERYRPEALRDLVSAEQAQLRWRALREFGEADGHLLVTNGPYRLKQWTADTVVLEAVREATYPLGFGTFDRYVHPPRAVIREVTQRADRIVVQADADITVKVGRDYRVERQALTHETTHGLFGLLVVSRYLLIGPDGTVLESDRMRWEKDESFVIELPQNLQPGQYTVVLAIFLDGNTMHPSAKLLRFHVGEQSPPG